MKRYYFAVAALIMIAALAIGLHYLVAQNSVTDQRRSEDLNKLISQVQTYARDNKKLPDGLSDLTQDSSLHYHDYTYKKDSISEFSLCTTFKTKVRESYYGNNKSPSSHDAGYQCFQEIASNLQPILYQPPLPPRQDTLCGFPYGPTIKRKPSAPIKYVDAANAKLATNEAGGAHIYYWTAYAPLVYGANCKQMQVQDIHEGQRVVIYASEEDIVHFVQFSAM